MPSTQKNFESALSTLQSSFGTPGILRSFFHPVSLFRARSTAQACGSSPKRTFMVDTVPEDVTISPDDQKNLETAVVPLQSTFSLPSSAQLNRKSKPKSKFRIRPSWPKFHFRSSASTVICDADTPIPNGEKDYEAALASLQSAVGLPGSIHFCTAPQEPSMFFTTTHKLANKATPVLRQTSKDYASAFASFQASYGF